jgi:aminoglycoside phosphotransferase (APT) family kinase protein
VLGAPFYVMERVAGTPYRFADELVPLGPERTRAISTGWSTRWRRCTRSTRPRSGSRLRQGPGLPRSPGARWKKQLDASHCRDLPAADELHALLAADVPEESAAGIVHGDYRLDNVLVDDADRCTAVLDWEMATLGDPLADLALMLVYHRLAEAGGGQAVTNASAAPGFLSEDEIIERYAQGSDRDLSRFGFYLGLAAYKLAAILEGIHYRYLHGQTVGEGFDTIGDAIHPLLDAGLSALKENH